MPNFSNLPWITLDHPDDYDGFPQICLIQWDDCINIKTAKQSYQKIGIVNNITVRGPMITNKQKNNAGFLSFVDLDAVHPKTVMRILGGFSGDMPLLIWCDIHKIKVPLNSIHEIALVSIRKTIGPLYYFKSDITQKRKTRRVTKPDQSNLRELTAAYSKIYVWSK